MNTELTRWVEIAALRDNRNMTLEVRATPEECRALAKRFDILEVKALTALLKISLGRLDSLFKIEGQLTAQVVQACSVTLDPVDEKIDEPIKEILTNDPANLASEDEAASDTDKPIELVEGDRIDVGEVVAQWLGLSLNPFPRSDAPPFAHIEDEAGIEGKQTWSPFKNLLQGLKGEKKS
ncbi:MAG: hypothetical protein JWM96_869 [Alphaproteobacteria bacterium]|nr:hypothetical protein [Alphaproteobacteria bacterium]